MNEAGGAGRRGGHYYLLADPRLAEAHDYSTVVPRTGADRSVQQTIPGTNFPQPQHLNNEGDGTYRGKAGTKPIVILKAESEDAKNGTIHAKPKKMVKEDTAKMNKDEGAARSTRTRPRTPTWRTSHTRR